MHDVEASRASATAPKQEAEADSVEGPESELASHARLRPPPISGRNETGGGWKAGAVAVLGLILAVGGILYWRYASRAADTAAAEAQKPKPVVAPPQPTNFVDHGAGVLKDQRNGLEWTQSDNASTVDWEGAHTYCARLAGGWRLPSVDELAGLYDPAETKGTACGTGRCQVSPLFRLSRVYFWSGTRNGPKGAWYVALGGNTGGVRATGDVKYSSGVRALCVRGP